VIASFNTYALVIGRAANVWRETLEAVVLLGKRPYCVVAVGRVGIDCPLPISYWASYHGYELAGWARHRSAALQRGCLIQFWSSTHGRHVDLSEKDLGVKYLESHVGGSSGLLGALVAWQVVHATKIVLAGIPMTEEGGRVDIPGVWDEAIIYREAWNKWKLELALCVRSMSGWTREVFGAPMEEWLTE
jgi:hypothetical protein